MITIHRPRPGNLNTARAAPAGMPIKAAIDTAQNVIHIESDTISTKSESKDQTSEKATEKASEKFNA